MTLDKLENGVQCCLTSLIAGYLYLSFLSLDFTCLFHSQSFQKYIPTVLQVLQPLS